MKISKSKQELARVVSENGGWRDGHFAAQEQNGFIYFYFNKPVKSGAFWHGSVTPAKSIKVRKLSNWHQCILSREEYYHLYPEPDAELDSGPGLGSTIGRDKFASGKINTGAISAHKPTIEQLAEEYRNLKGLADRKQAEADTAKADAEAKLAELVAAGKENGLVVSVADVETELVIADRRDLRAEGATWDDLLEGDEMLCVIPFGGGVIEGSVGIIRYKVVDRIYIDFPEQRSYVYHKSHFDRGDVKFIRRP